MTLETRVYNDKTEILCSTSRSSRFSKDPCFLLVGNGLGDDGVDPRGACYYWLGYCFGAFTEAQGINVVCFLEKIFCSLILMFLS